MHDRLRIRSVEVLSDDWARLSKATFDYRRNDGRWETQVRQSYDHGHGAAILPYDPARGTVLLVRQFRYPAYASGCAEPLIEACAGMLDGDDPESCIRREAEEELGYRLGDIRLLFSLFSSPGCNTERIFFFCCHYTESDRIAGGGGRHDEGEDIEVIEMALGDAAEAMRDGRIIDAKTVVLIQNLMMERARGD